MLRAKPYAMLLVLFATLLIAPEYGDAEIELTEANYLVLNSDRSPIRARLSATGNFDGDPELEILEIDNTGATYVMEIVDPDGTGSSFTPGNTATVKDILVGDCNNDGIDDVIIAEGTAGFTVFTGDGARGLDYQAAHSPMLRDTPVPVAGRVDAIDWIDIDNDNFADLVIAFGNNTTPAFNFSQVWFNHGVVAGNNQGCTFSTTPATDGTTGRTYGGFEEWGPNLPDRMGDVHVFDLNRDGNPDILLSSGNTTYFFKGLAGRDPRSPTTWFARQTLTNSHPYGLFETGDFDRDGYLDIFAACTDFSDACVHYYETQGGPTTFAWGAPFLLKSGYWPSTVAPARIRLHDFNYDGWLDVIVAGDGLSGAEAWIFYHGADPSNPSSIPNAAGSQIGFSDGEPRSVEVNDFDQDGDLDLLLSGWYPLGVPQLVAAPGRRNHLFGKRRLLPSPPFGPPYPNEALNGVAMGNVDGNGAEDIAFSETQRIRIYNSDLGTYTFGATSGSVFRHLQFADMNNDGRLDLVVADTGASDQVGVFVSQPDNTFSPGFVAPTSARILSLDVADIDRDGFLDLVYVTPDGFHARRNLSGSGFEPEPPPFDAPSLPTDGLVVAADFNEDGFVDVLTHDRFGQRYEVFLNDGAGGLNPSGVPIPSTAPSRAMTVCRVRGSGGLDVVAADVGGNLRLIQSDTAGGLISQRVSNSPNVDVGAVICADFDNDGDNDIYGSRGLPGSDGLVWINDGAGTFAASDERPFNDGPNNVLGLGYGDFDGDGDIDIFESSTVSGGEHAWRENPVVVRGHFNVEPTQIWVERPNVRLSHTAKSGLLHRGPTVPLRLRLFDRNKEPVPEVILEYSRHGSGKWLPAEIKDPSKLIDIPMSVNPVTIDVEWVLPRGTGADHLRSDDARIRARVVQQRPRRRSDRTLQRPSATVSGPIAVDDLCAGHSCPQLCYFGVCYDQCNANAACSSNSCYITQGFCDSTGDPCMNDVECGGGTCNFDPGRCDVAGDPDSSLACPIGMVAYEGACFDSCTSTDECDATEVCYSAEKDVCQTDPCQNVNCPIGEVCYQGSCFGTVCADDGDCTPPNVCFDNHCELDPCEGVACPIGQVCYEGACYDPCNGSDPCSPPNICFQNLCYDPANPCKDVVCGTDETCVGGECAKNCTMDSECAPYSVDSGGNLLDCNGVGTDSPDCLICYNNRCLAPETPCDGILCPIGQRCYFGACYDTCTVTGNCDGDVCYDDTANADAPICLDATDPCADVSCPDDQICHEGACYLTCGSTDACTSDADCTADDETCQDGYCVRCDPESETCWQSYCAPTACTNVQCPIGQVCYAGSCYETCSGTTSCTSLSDACFEDERCAEDACDGIFCPIGEVCRNGSCYAPCAESDDCPGYDGSFEFAFRDVSTDANLAVPGDKKGGASWADIDLDGDCDLVINTNDGVVSSRLFRNNGDGTFADITFLGGTYAKSIGDSVAERSIVWGDYNGDGYIDFARNDNRRIEIYANKGRTGTPQFGFGVGADAKPNQLFSSWPLGGTFNVEGMAWLDFDRDGDLDLLANSDRSIVLLENSAGVLDQKMRPADYGLPTGAGAGDYCAVADLDVDGDIDIVCRMGGTGARATRDIWFNNGAGSFAAVGPDLDAPNTNKGGVAVCDLDNDGLFDLVWTDGPQSRVLHQTAVGTFVERDEPRNSSGFTMPTDIDGVDCGDVDNDGDLDLIFAGGSTTYLFENDSEPGILLFNERDDVGLVGAASDAESINFVDYDSDGDLDIFINEDGATRLYNSNRGASNSVEVKLLRDYGSGRETPAIGATVTVRDADRNTLGVREISGGKGHGSQGALSIHYGLPMGPQVPYLFEVRFPDGARVSKCVIPAKLTNPEVVIRDTDADDLSDCALPDWGDYITRRTEPPICFAPELDDRGVEVKPAYCAADACEGVQCPDGENCYQGSCFAFCTNDRECDPGSICFSNRCVDSEDRYCDGVVCPIGDVCYRGECFGGCVSDSDCGSRDFCYRGRCAPTDCSGVEELCEADESCFRGTCFDDCAADPTVCDAGESCFEGRCAEDGCAALTYTYDAEHPFRKMGRRLGAEQQSMPWYWPRPVVTSDRFEDWVKLNRGVETNEVPELDRARVSLVLDETLRDGRNRQGKYVLYLTQGFDSGIGSQLDGVGYYTIRISGSNERTGVIFQNQDEGYIRKSDGDEEYYVVRLTNETDSTAGIAIGPLEAGDSVDWTVTIQAALGGDLAEWEFYNPEMPDEPMVLKQSEPLRIRNLPLRSTHFLTPSSGMECDVDPAIGKGQCGRGTIFCGTDGSTTCERTVAAWPYELCDGIDNDCDGVTDENPRYPMSDWKQGGGGWSYFVATDTRTDLSTFMNYRQRGTDDRRGSTNVTGYGGVAIQGDKKTLTLMHRDITSGLLAMPLVHGRYINGLAAAGYSDDDIYMTLGLDTDHPDDVFIAFHDDARPVATNDEIPDSFDATDREVGLDWRLAKASSTERESDSVAVRPLVRPWDSDPKVQFSIEFDGALGASNDEDDPEELEWRLYQPQLSETRLLRSQTLFVRSTLRPALTTVCPARTSTASGCNLGRYQCVSGEVICGPAVDGACDLCFDGDGDGYERYDAATCPTGLDCNDSNVLVYPGAEEICDGIDNDCDGEIDVTLNGTVAFGETLSCGNGEDECGPAECDYAFTCTCPDGPEDPDNPPSAPCICGSALAPDHSVPEALPDATTSTSNQADSTKLDEGTRSRTNGTTDPDASSSGCSTGGSSSPIAALIAGGIALLFRRRRT